MRDLPLKLLYLILPVLGLLILLVDSLHFLLQIDLTVVTISLSNLHDLLVVGFVAVWMLLVNREFLTAALPVKEKLWRLTILLTTNFVLAFVLQLFLDPDYLQQPLRYANYSATLYANTVGLVSILTLLPIMQLLRSLIFYRQKRTTHLYFNLFLSLILVSSIWVYFSREPLGFEPGSGSAMDQLLSAALIIVCILLSLRNDWITYLPRREKFMYFLLGLIIGIQVFTLWELIFDPHLRAFSLIAANIVHIIWLLLVIYCSVGLFTLLVYLPTSKAFDRKIREVNSLNDFSRMLNSELNRGKLYQLITQLTAQVLESHSTWLELSDEKGKTLKLTSHINMTQEQILNNPLTGMDGFNLQVIRAQKPQLVNDLVQQKELQHLVEWKQEARSLLAAPLLSHRGKLLGMLYATKQQAFGFDSEDALLMEGFANQAAIALENATLWNASLEKERMEQELRVAREVQLKLIPQTMPDIPGYAVDSYFLTAYEVGGDYYDFIEFKDGSPGFVIGDVSGKGTSAAFYMAELKGIIETLAKSMTTPMELASNANRIIYKTIDRQSFVTAIIGKLFPRQHRFEFVRAGHTPVLHCSSETRQVRFLQPPGMGIGLEKGAAFDKLIKTETVDLKPGDLLLLFTDGLIEMRNASGAEFEMEGLPALLQNCRDKTVEEIKEHILEGLMAFSGNTALHDDLTLILIKRLPDDRK